MEGGARALEPSHTFLECSAYFSTTGRMLDVTMRWARLKLWSISGRGQRAVSRCARGESRTLQREGYGLLELLKLFGKTQVALRRGRTHS